jgi:hypothetical protein
MTTRATAPHRKISVTPTITSAYSSGDVLGGKLTFAGAAKLGGGGGTVTSVVVTSKIAWANLDLVLFDSDCTVPADNAAATLNAADVGKVIGVYNFTAGTAIGTPSAASSGTQLGFQAGAAGAIYGMLITRGTPTYTAGDLTVTITVVPDQG